MNTKRNIKLMLVAFILLFGLLAFYLVYIVDAYGIYWFSSAYNTRIEAKKKSVIAGDLLDRDGVRLVTSSADGQRIYSSDERIRFATAHVVGDNNGQLIAAQALFAKYLLGFDQGIGAEVGSALTGKRMRGYDVTMSISAALCSYAYDELEGYAGAVVVMNYQTGEILAMTARPSFDPARVADYLLGEYALEESSMVNRATMGRYTPGSIFKLVTTVAALRYIPGVEQRTFTCDGPIVFDKKTGKCVEDASICFDPDGTLKDGYVQLADYENEYHGELTLKEAFAKSCNHVYAQLAMEIGERRLKLVAEELGFNSDFMFEDIVVYSGTYAGASSDFELAWSGVGQHTDIATPMHMCLVVSAVANGGVMMEPKLLVEARTLGGDVKKSMQSEEKDTCLKGNEADFLKAAMLEAVASGTGTRAKVAGFRVAGKTGTAQISSDGKTQSHAWFAGFIDDAAHPYAICVIVEKAGGGGTVAAPIAGRILARSVELIDQP